MRKGNGGLVIFGIPGEDPLRRNVQLFFGLLGFSAVLFAKGGTEPQDSGATLRINSRAVLVDVIVSDSHGNPVTGLKQDAFSVTEQGKAQTISYFEEHKAGTDPARPVEFPKLPQNVFTNFSPLPQAPAVTVLLLDSLNTHMENQSYVHAQAEKFLKTARPGSRMAIFAMGLGLHFIQGFTDDPAVLAAALKNKKNNPVETSVMLKGQDEANAQANVISMMSAPMGNGATAASPESIAALSNFLQENDDSRQVDRVLLTLENFNRLATFLNSFPGRKNVIWFSEAFPLVVGGAFDPRMDDRLSGTLDLLAAARIALYPVDARGVSGYSLYDAGANLPAGTSQASQLLGGPTVGGAAGAPNAGTGGFSNSIATQAIDRNDDQDTMKRMAEETGGKAFVNSNGLAHIMGDIAESSGNFYTLSYSPQDAKLDGTYRRIEVKVEGGANYRLSYRRGYIALDENLPGSGMMQREKAIHQLAEKNPGAVDPLLPFMDLGMPQSEQILYEARIQPAALGDKREPGDPKGAAARYTVDFAVDAKDLRLPQGPDGLRAGTLNISLRAYDRYGNVVSRKDHLVQLRVKPDVWAVYQNTGVQLHADIAVPKGNYWLRTGIFDQQSRKVGTMEVPLAAVQQIQAAAQAK
jgi:VWFA-related protein